MAAYDIGKKVIVAALPLNNGCPCKGCTDRKLGCHSECSRYEGWTIEMGDIKAKEKEYRDSERSKYIDPNRLKKNYYGRTKGFGGSQ